MRKRKPDSFVVSSIATALSISVPTLLTGAGAAASAAGTGASILQTREANVAAEQQARASRRAEQLRKEQMLAESRKAQLDADREAIKQSAQVRANINNAGSNYGNSSAPGAAAGVFSTLGTDRANIGGAEARGLGLFDANAAAARAEGRVRGALADGQFSQSLGNQGGNLLKLGAGLFNGAGGAIGAFRTETNVNAPLPLK